MQNAYTLYGRGDTKGPGINYLRNRIGRSVVALLAASATFAATPGFAVPRYDGIWSVAIVTKKGDCIASYRYPMRISNGILVDAGDLLISVSGKVAPNGAVTVTVSHGDTSAAGSGRLSGTVGSGSWSVLWLLDSRTPQLVYVFS